MKGNLCHRRSTGPLGGGCGSESAAAGHRGIICAVRGTEMGKGVVEKVLFGTIYAKNWSSPSTPGRKI